MTPEDVLRALADPERLAVAGALARRGRTAGDLAEELGLPAARVQHHLSRLTAAGLVKVEWNRRTYRLNTEALRSAAREAGPPRDPGLALGAVYEEEESVLRHYFRGGRLTEVPAKRSKRLIVLQRLALEFDPGIRYSERDVNSALRRFHDDYAALRRYLVDAGFLSRERGEYWRSGGPVEI
jgi:hypothetical protein